MLELQGPEGAARTLRFEARMLASQVTVMHALCVQGRGNDLAVSEEDQQALADIRPTCLCRFRQACAGVAGGVVWGGVAAADALNEIDGVNSPLRVSP